MVFSDDHRLEPNDHTQLQLETTHRGTTKVCLFTPTDFPGTHTITAHATQTAVGEFMADLRAELDLRSTAGTYTIAQSHTAWTGFGIDPFVTSLEQPYDHQGLEQSAHHREVGAWTASTNTFHPDLNRVLVTAVRRTQSEVAEDIYAHFFVDGIPIAGDIPGVLEAIPGTVRTAQPWGSELDHRFIATPSVDAGNSLPGSATDTAAAERLLAAIEADTTEQVTQDELTEPRGFWIENPYHENAAALRADFGFDEAVTYDTLEYSQSEPSEATRWERYLYELIPSLGHLRVHIGGGSNPDSYEVDTVELQRLRPKPSGQAEISNVNIRVKGTYEEPE